MKITDNLWDKIRKYFPEEQKDPRKAGRKSVDTRKVFEAVLWIARTGAQWKELPQYFPNYKTVHRRYKKWVDGGIFEKILCKITQELKEKNIINDAETFIDGSFIPALFCIKGGGKKVKYGRKGKGSTLMAIVDSKGLPLSLAIDSADRHEVKLVQLTFDFYYLNTYPDKVVGDKAYDSDDLDKKMKEKNINVIAPHKKKRKPENKTQDGRFLRRVKRRWKIERYFAWLKNWRRTTTRYELYPSLYLGFTQIVAVLLLLKQF